MNLKSFSKAAQKLYISQPAVTKQVKALEKEFGAVFLKRDYNEIIPTKEGKALYKYASTVLSKEEELYARLNKKSQVIAGELTVFTSTLPANYLLDELLMAFSQKYEKVTYNIHKTDSNKVYEEVKSGRTGFGFTGMRKSNRNIECVKIAKDQLVLAVSGEKFSRFEEGVVGLEFLLEQDLLIRRKESATLKTFEEALKKENHSVKDFNIKAVVDDNEIIKKMIIKGLGVSVMSRLAIEKEISEGTILSLEIKGVNLRRSIYYIYHRNRYISGAAQKFKEFILDKYQQN